MNTMTLITIMLIVGTISFVALIGILVFFGSLIKHQFKIWLLRNKGYIQVRHIREDMNEKNYFIRIKDDHYDFAGGVYLEQKNTKTKSEHILAKFDYELLSKKPIVELDALEVQMLAFFKGIKSNELMDIKTLGWGIPTISYFGNNPNPINYRDIKKVYDAKNIASLIKRILMTKEWKLVRMVLILCSIAIVGLLLLGFVDYKVAKTNSENLHRCQMMLNDTTNKCLVMFNNTIVPAMNQNRTIII